MKTERLHLRVSEELKNEIKKEADKLGLTISAYLIYTHKKERGVNKMTREEMKASKIISEVMDLELESVKEDIKHDYITLHKGEDKKIYAWYYDGSDNEWAIDLEGKKEIRLDELQEFVPEIKQIIEEGKEIIK